MGHLITAACLHHRVTGRDEFLNIARKTADFLDETFRDPTPELARNSVCPSHYMAMVELYRTTREPRYLALAQKFLDMRNLVTDGGDDNQDRIPFLEQREAVGHAVRANYLYAGAADLYLGNGRRAACGRRSKRSGRTSSRRRCTSPAAAARSTTARRPTARTISRTSPACTRPTAATTSFRTSRPTTKRAPRSATCCGTGGCFWRPARRSTSMCWSSRSTTPCSRGVSLDGTDYFYVNPLRQVEPLPTKLRWSRDARAVRHIVLLPAERAADDCRGERLRVQQDGRRGLGQSLRRQHAVDDAQRQAAETDADRPNYPWDGRVRITIDECPPTEFALKLRIPGWAEAATIRVNGRAANVRSERRHATPRFAAAGNRATSSSCDLPMPARLIEANPLVEETRNQVAIKRGPIVYCLESPDLPKGVRVQDVVDPGGREAIATLRCRSCLSGVTVIEATRDRQAVRRLGRASSTARSARAGRREFKLRFIPYYAWSNRGPSEMSVWLPVK